MKIAAVPEVSEVLMLCVVDLQQPIRRTREWGRFQLRFNAPITVKSGKMILMIGRAFTQKKFDRTRILYKLIDFMCFSQNNQGVNSVSNLLTCFH